MVREIFFPSPDFEYSGKIDLHAITQPRFALLAHPWLGWIKSWLFCRHTNFLVHRTHRRDVVKIAAFDSVIYLLFHHEEGHICLNIAHRVDRRRWWHDVCDLLAAGWVQNVHVD